MKKEQQINQILSEGFASVSKSGVRAFTVDAFSKHISMSKKTIYKFFPTKENLINSIVSFVYQQLNDFHNKVMKEENNPCVQFIKIMEYNCEFVGKTNVNRLAELKTLYPRIWKRTQSFWLDQEDNFYTILKSAQEKGYASNKNVDMKAASVIYINVINNTFQPEFFIKNNLPLKETIHGFVNVVAKGLFNDKGMVAIKKYYEHNRK